MVKHSLFNCLLLVKNHILNHIFIEVAVFFRTTKTSTQSVVNVYDHSTSTDQSSTDIIVDEDSSAKHSK
jgi:hypothetical protein